MTKIRKNTADGSGVECQDHRKTILVVDDEATIRNILVQVLRLRGYRVLSAMNGVDALRILGDPQERIDVLITDLMMPLMCGNELIEIVLMSRPEVKPICLSASSAAVSLNRAVLFLPKPFSLQAIVASVQEALGSTLPNAKMTG
jgi:DNA-binding NtrC family response regulator